VIFGIREKLVGWEVEVECDKVDREKIGRKGKGDIDCTSKYEDKRGDVKRKEGIDGFACIVKEEVDYYFRRTRKVRIGVRWNREKHRGREAKKKMGSRGGIP